VVNDGSKAKILAKLDFIRSKATEENDLPGKTRFPEKTSLIGTHDGHSGDAFIGH
jgi:hypothetical protein